MTDDHLSQLTPDERNAAQRLARAAGGGAEIADVTADPGPDDPQADPNWTPDTSQAFPPELAGKVAKALVEQAQQRDLEILRRGEPDPYIPGSPEVRAYEEATWNHAERERQLDLSAAEHEADAEPDWWEVARTLARQARADLAQHHPDREAEAG